MNLSHSLPSSSNSIINSPFSVTSEIRPRDQHFLSYCESTFIASTNDPGPKDSLQSSDPFSSVFQESIRRSCR